MNVHMCIPSMGFFGKYVELLRARVLLLRLLLGRRRLPPSPLVITLVLL
jgi:hypothetical protein